MRSLILPIEIWLAILEYLSRWELKSLASTCKPFRSALFPFFRCTAVIDLSRQPESYAEALVPVDHRRMVTNLTMLVRNRIQRGGFDSAINFHLSNLAHFSNLTEFHWVQRHPIPKQLYLFLRYHSSLRVLKIETELDVLPEDLLGGLGLPPRCALTMTSIGRYDIMKDIFQYYSATRRTIAHLVILDVHLLQALNAEIGFPSLVHLDLRLTSGTMYLPFLFKFLGSNPTIERITLHARDPNLKTRTHKGRPPALPRLKHFTANIKCNSPFLSLAFGRRTLETLSLAGAFLSAREVQNIHWEELNVIDIILEDMEARGALIRRIEALGSSGKLAWQKVTIRTSNLDLASWTDNLDVRNPLDGKGMCIFQPPIDVFQVLHKLLTVMVNRAPHLTHLHVISAFYFFAGG